MRSSQETTFPSAAFIWWITGYFPPDCTQASQEPLRSKQAACTSPARATWGFRGPRGRQQGSRHEPLPSLAPGVAGSASTPLVSCPWLKRALLLWGPGLDTSPPPAPLCQIHLSLGPKPGLGEGPLVSTAREVVNQGQVRACVDPCSLGLCDPHRPDPEPSAGPGWRELSTSGAHSLQQKPNHGRGEALVPREVQVRVQARVGTPPLPCACSGWPAPSCTVASAQLIKVLTRWRLLRLDLHPC